MERKLKIRWNGPKESCNGREEAVRPPTENSWEIVSVRVFAAIGEGRGKEVFKDLSLPLRIFFIAQEHSQENEW